MVYPPSPSVAAPMLVPSTITLAPARACPSDELTVPLSLPVVCVQAKDTIINKDTNCESFLIVLPPYCIKTLV